MTEKLSVELGDLAGRVEGSIAISPHEVRGMALSADRLEARMADANARLARVTALANRWQDYRTWEGAAGARLRAALLDIDGPTPNTKEANIAFRKAWDARVDEGRTV